MREAKKILAALKEHYPQEIDVFESMNERDRKGYAGYVLRKTETFLSPREWLERKYSLQSFSQIAQKLGISRAETVEIYEGAMIKIKSIMEEINE